MNKDDKEQHHIVVLIGRVLLGGLFCISGILSLLNFEQFIDLTASAPLLSLAPVLVASVAIVLKIVCGLALALGYYARCAATALFIFTLLATLFFHLSLTDMSLFKNLMIAGGLLVFVGFGGGQYVACLTPKRH